MDAKWVRQDVSDKRSGTPLFRKRAERSASYRLFGSVTVIVPPSGYAALLIGMVAMLLLGFAAWYVEIPQRARAVGVLMPPGGFLNVVAGATGRATNITVTEGQVVDAGDVLLSINTDQEPFAVTQLQSLRVEIALLAEARNRQLMIDDSQLLALDERLDSINLQLAITNTEHQLHGDEVELLKRRLERREGLVSKGSISVDALEQERAVLLQARARGEAIQHAVFEYKHAIATNLRARAEAMKAAERAAILHELEFRRLQRQIDEHEHLISQQVRATGTGVVARINVREGVAVSAGETVARIYRPREGLEAWLYLSSAEAGFVQAGQTVQLRLDAYPYQQFGTSSAIVTSVSSIAIIPADVNIPLALSGPVFEVRATLHETHVEAFNEIWPLAPGISFEADLVQRRYKLYEWLLRATRSRGSRA